MIGSESKQIPTFWPYHHSSTHSKSINQSNVRKYQSTNKKCDKTVIWKDSSGRPIHSMFVNDKITIDFIENKQKNYQRQRISIEDEDQTKCWLKRINFHNYLSITNTDLMEDPFRNGVLFWELIWFLENIQLYDVFYTPKVIKDWRDNIDKFFSVWHQIDWLRENMSPRLLSNKELILKGDQVTTIIPFVILPLKKALFELFR